MRGLLISDIHGNPWALEAVVAAAGEVDFIICGGDLVNYGPDPASVVELVRSLAATCVRGNHDHAVARLQDPHAAPAKQPLALAMRDWTRAQLSEDQLKWLGELPLNASEKHGAARFLVVHGTPRDPLFDYRLQPGIDERLFLALIEDVDADVLVLGHTHLPLIRRRGALQVVNPGSVGQPLDGDPRAAYAIWEDGTIRLQRTEYDRNQALASIEKLRFLSIEQRDELKSILFRGRSL